MLLLFRNTRIIKKSINFLHSHLPKFHNVVVGLKNKIHNFFLAKLLRVFYKVVARPSLLYGSETWVTMKRDMTRLEAAEMRFLRSVTGYTRLDKIRREVIKEELEISGILDVRLRYKQNWINHLERMDNTRLLKHALNYKPRGRRDLGRPRKRWQCIDAGTGQTT